MQRDMRIDIVRGAGILMIALDHLGGVATLLAPDGFVLPFVTWTRIGWSSAAEFFVFFSGFLIGLVYARTLEARGSTMVQARAVQRSWEIYAANVLTLCLTIALLHSSFLGSPRLIEAAQLSDLVGADAGESWSEFLTLVTAPMFFEILQLYVVLLLVAPAVLLLARVNLLAAFAVSFATWLVVQFNPAINLAAWHFNPFAWQLVFVLGMLFSVADAFARIERRFSRSQLLWTTGAFLVTALVIKAIDKSGVALPLVGALHLEGTEKEAVGPLRLVHFLVSVVFVMQLMPRGARAQASLPIRSVARIGRYSLECFCASTVAVYACAGFLLNIATIGTGTVLIGGIALVIAICAFAVLMEWIRSEPWRGAGAKRESSKDAVDSNAIGSGATRFAIGGTGEA